MANVRLAKIDLAYLLKQVKIGTDYTQLFGALDPAGVREVNSANNNLVGAYDQFGNYTPGANPLGGRTTADTDFLRLTYTNTPGEDAQGTTYAQVDPNNPMEMGTSVVLDSSVRLITNLISSSITDPLSPIYNPAAVAARDAAAQGTGGGDVPVGSTVYPQTGTTTAAFIGDQGVLGGAAFNEFFVAFGQFFDHGLDFISKGGGFVAIPLSPNDPLYIDPLSPEYIHGASNIMYLNRAKLSNPASDFDANGNLLPGAVASYNNNTGFMIDQSQTYGSHATVNALLRQYDDQGRATGLLITSAEDGNVTSFDGSVYTYNDLSLAANADITAKALHNMATWADMVFNAARIGVILTDADSQDVPAIRVDNTGKLLYTPNGTLWSTAVPAGWTGLAGQDASDPFVRNEDGTVVRTNQTMFADMAQGTDTGSNDPLVRDDLLAIHYVSGDGRTNENIGLTAVHNIFHEEHNLQSRNVMNSVMTEAAALKAAGSTDAEVAAFVNEWTRVTGTASDGVTGIGYYDSEGVAQVLTVAGINIDSATGGTAWDGDYVFQAGRLITESEYNHIAINDYVRSLAVYLPEFVSYSTDVVPNVSLEFSQSVFRLGHSMLTEQLQVAITDVNGKNPGEVGYVETFENVDLFDAFLNPGLYEATGSSEVTLGLLRQQANGIDEFVTPALQQTLVGAPLDLAALNLARSRDVGLPTLNELRQQVYTGQVAFNADNAGSALAPYTSWQDFGAHLRTPESLVNFIAAYGRDNDPLAHNWGIDEARAAYQAGTATLADIRAAAQAVLDAYSNAADPLHDDAVAFMEGAPSYNETSGQWEFGEGDQGIWDIDLWMGGLAERPTFDGPLGTTFSYIMLDFGQRLMDGDRFYYLYRMPVGHHLGDELLSHTFSEMIERTTGLEHTGSAFGDQTARFILDSTGALTSVDSNSNINDFFDASQHMLPDGLTPANEGHIIVSGGDGNDYIAGGLGDDYIYGDAGNDTIQGSQGNDNIFGGDGDDWIYDDENDDTINGGNGNDHIFAGVGVLDVVHGAAGNDDVHGGDGIDEVYGDDGDDEVFGEGDTDLMMGGEGNDYMNGGDGVDEMFGGNGNDWMQGNVGDDNINGGSGNDLLEGGLGAVANDGDRLNGDSPIGLGRTIIEWNGDGTQGDMDIGSYEDADIPITANLQNSNQNGTGSTLMDTYAFLEGLVGSRAGDDLTGADAATSTSNGANNYLIGGGGDDTMRGLGGDDFIFGDSAIVDNSLYNDLDARYGNAHSAVTGATIHRGEVRTTYADGSKGHVLGDSGPIGTADKVVFTGALSEYTVTKIAYVDPLGNSHNAFRIEDTVANRDGNDVVVDCELAQFSDGTYSLVPPTVAITDPNGNEGNAGTHNASFTVALSNSYILPVTVSYTTNDGSATTADLDYDANSGTVTFPAALASAPAGSATIDVVVRGDTLFELNETFTVDLSAPTNGATLADNQGQATITNDDAMPSLTIADVSIVEGHTGSKLMTFTVTQSAVSGVETTVNWGWADNTAWAGLDFVGSWGTVTIPAGSTTGTFTVEITGDVTPEPNETFTVYLSGAVNATIADSSATGTIIDDDLNLRMNPLTPSNTALPGTVQFATMSSEPGATFTYQLVASSAPSGGFTVSPAGAVSRTGTAMQAGETYTLDVQATETTTMAATTETITIKTGTAAGDTLTAAAGDTLLYGNTGDDTLESGAGDDGLLGQGGNDTGSYAAAAAGVTVALNVAGVQNTGGAGKDTLVGIENLTGSAHNDLLRGDSLANLLSGGAGADTLQGNGGNDTLTGGTGDDILSGGAHGVGGGDTAVFTGNVLDFGFTSSGPTFFVVKDLVGTQGSDIVETIEKLQIGATTYAVTIDALANGNTIGNAAGTGSMILLGRSGNDTLNGGTAADILVGGAGIDWVNGGDGDDVFVTYSTEGHDVIDGGNGAGDTFSLIGDASAEVFRIYSATAWLALGVGHTLMDAASGIVVTRNGTTDAQIVAELRNVEELRVLTSTGGAAAGALADGNSYTGGTGDTVQVIGNFVGTGLAYNTITVSGDANDTVDITGLASDHRVVFNTGGTGGNVIGDLRPQDIVNGTGGSPAAGQHLQDQISGANSVTAVAFNEPMLNDVAGTVQDHLAGQSWQSNWASENLIQPGQLTGPQLGLSLNQSVSGLGQTFENLAPMAQQLETDDLGMGREHGTQTRLHRNFELGINQSADELSFLNQDHHFLF